ncbi:IS1634 family transposase [Methanosalsum natronophilum]|uniref:IS1634 family transposase n=1 Tax=Methanosalsum natronophilum TaxID=768733 RepID=UPI0021699D2D|nr:IS1634 family transposase [Methanosalsum natronophilum]MCS3924037.1 transposase [Methanosalsum natronophilum]
MKKQKKLRTNKITPNENISFPIGTSLAVEYFYETLDFDTVFGKHKKNGIDINKLIKALLSYKLTDNFSISRAHQWINRDEVLDIFRLDSFSERTLYRVLETIGNNRLEIISDIQDRIFLTYDFEHTNINLDWTSIVLHGNKAPLADYGYSRDHRPDKKQITLGITEIAEPINVPIGITTEKGNVADQTHFKITYDQVRKRLEKGSLVVFDRGANSLTNTQMVLADHFEYLSGKQLNKSDDKIIATFWNQPIELISSKEQIYCLKIQKPSGVNYLYFSPKLQKEQLASKARKIKRQIEEARQIQSSIDKNKKLPKKFRINNVLIDVEYSLQTKLAEIDENEALKMLQDKLITGREGFFCLRSSTNLTAKDALEIYRKKDSVEKIIHSLKNEIEIKPLRVWSDASIYGAVVIGFIAQLFISLMRFEFKELKSTSTKFIKKSLLNLTVTVDFTKKKVKEYIYSNFDAINTVILEPKWLKS